MLVWWLISYGTKVRTGALVSNRPCEPCQISIPAALLASVNGYGIERRLDENSSFDRPATNTLPSTYLIEVIVSMLCRSCVGPSGRLTDACLMLSSETSLIFPAASVR